MEKFARASMLEGEGDGAVGAGANRFDKGEAAG
jgi:hypothetical protein